MRSYGLSASSFEDAKSCNCRHIFDIRVLLLQLWTRALQCEENTIRADGGDDDGDDADDGGDDGDDDDDGGGDDDDATPALTHLSFIILHRTSPRQPIV